MKKNLIIIGAIILAIHLGLLLIFFRSHRPAGTEEPPVAPSGEAPAESGQPSGGGTPRQSAGTDRTPSPPTTAKPRFTPLDYSGVVSGDLAAVAGTAEVRSGILVDLGSRKVLWQKNARTAVPVASMSKMLTVLLAMEMVENNAKYSLESPVTVTRSATKAGGRSIWLDPRETFPLEDLLRATQIHSANDAAELVAEFLGDGDSAKYVERMNRRASELGLRSIKIFNAHGMPGTTAAEDNVGSAEDMAALAERLLHYPKVVAWSSTRLGHLHSPLRDPPTNLENPNRLLRDDIGVDGMKTGFINRSGFCAAVTCERGARRLVAVVTGFPSQGARDGFLRKLLDWGYEQK